jgi:hypothetical protein
LKKKGKIKIEDIIIIKINKKSDKIYTKMVDKEGALNELNLGE